MHTSNVHAVTDRDTETNCTIRSIGHTVYTIVPRPHTTILACHPSPSPSPHMLDGHCHARRMLRACRPATSRSRAKMHVDSYGRTSICTCMPSHGPARLLAEGTHCVIVSHSSCPCAVRATCMLHAQSRHGRSRAGSELPFRWHLFPQRIGPARARGELSHDCAQAPGRKTPAESQFNEGGDGACMQRAVQRGAMNGPAWKCCCAVCRDI